jgi:hypothetical protein
VPPSHLLHTTWYIYIVLSLSLVPTKVMDSDVLAWVRGQRKMSQLLGAFGLLDFTMLRSVLVWRAYWNLWTVYLFNFQLFFGPQYTADTVSVDRGVRLYLVSLELGVLYMLNNCHVLTNGRSLRTWREGSLAINRVCFHCPVMSVHCTDSPLLHYPGIKC